MNIMTFDDVLHEPSDKQRILDYIQIVRERHPYKPNIVAEYDDRYNKAWNCALDEVESFIENL